MANKFCVTIKHCLTDGDKATVGFVVANAALGSEKDTLVFLSAEGVRCAVKGEAEKIDLGAPFAPLERDARLVAERVQPAEAAVYERSRMAGQRPPVVPAIPDEPRRPRRPPVLGDGS